MKMTRTNSVYNLQTDETTVVPFTDEQNAAQDAYERDVLPLEQMAAIRQQRNERLQETDYLALADATLTDEMTAYRQTLRDLPANTTDPANPVWPTKPGGES
jgi:hypothetical protein